MKDIYFAKLSSAYMGTYFRSHRKSLNGVLTATLVTCEMETVAGRSKKLLLFNILFSVKEVLPTKRTKISFLISKKLTFTP